MHQVSICLGEDVLWRLQCKDDLRRALMMHRHADGSCGLRQLALPFGRVLFRAWPHYYSHLLSWMCNAHACGVMPSRQIIASNSRNRGVRLGSKCVYWPSSSADYSSHFEIVRIDEEIPRATRLTILSCVLLQTKGHELKAAPRFLAANPG